MGKESGNNIRLGLFVLVGTLFIIIGMYFIGSKQNLFSSTFKLYADFKNVNGLMDGNNVRFNGINVGTVESIKIINDTTLRVTMIIKKKSNEFIKQNAIARIGTDGLMGNKLINLSPSNMPSQVVQDGDRIQTLQNIETEELFNTLTKTNEDVAVTAKNLKEMTTRLNGPNSLWTVLMDTTLALHVKRALVNIELTSTHSAVITGDLSKIVKDIKSGKGSIGALITDTILSTKLHQSVVNIKIASDTLAYISGDLRDVSKKIRNGSGSIGTLVMDTNFAHDLKQSMENIKTGSDGFSQTIEALKHSIFFRGYFRKKERLENQK